MGFGCEILEDLSESRARFFEELGRLELELWIDRRWTILSIDHMSSRAVGKLYP